MSEDNTFYVDIDWREIRENYFKECVGDTKKVIMSPHDLIEWFKKQIDKYKVNEL